MADAKTSFWTPPRIGAVIGVVLLVVLLAYAASLPRRGDVYRDRIVRRPESAPLIR